MNGIMPGPLWLAIASATNSTTVETRNPTHPAKNATVTGELTDIDRITSDLATQGSRGGGSHSPSATRKVKREGG